MRVSEERQKFYIAEIRNIMIKNPGISILGLCDILKEKNLPLDKNYVLKLRHKVEKKRERVINLNTVRYSLEEIDEINLKIKKLWEIIDAPRLWTSNSDKVSAIKCLRDERIRLEEIVMHLTGTQKDLGKISIEHTLTPELEAAIAAIKMQFGQKTKGVIYEEAITKETAAQEIKKIDAKPANPNIIALPGGGSIDTKGPAIAER